MSRPTRSRRADFIQVREQAGAIPGLCYRAISTLCGGGFQTSTGWISANTWHANISYVTGAHNVKFGYNGLYDYDNQDSNFANPEGLVYQFNNGVPNQFWELSGQFKSQWRTRYDAFFAQDSWTREPDDVAGRGPLRARVELLPGVEHRRHALLPDADDDSRKRTASTSTTSMPRGGLAYDLFGNGRTSLKVNGGQYVAPAQNAGIYTGAAPTSAIVTAATRSWIGRQPELRRRLQPEPHRRAGSDRRRAAIAAARCRTTTSAR